MTNLKPLLFIDVDGVLNRDYGSRSKAKKAGCRTYGIEGPDGRRHQFHANPYDRERLESLLDVYDLAWGTTWEFTASWNIAHVLGLPTDLPFATWRAADGHVRDHTGDLIKNKAPGVLRLAVGRPFAWLEDEAVAYTAELSFLAPSQPWSIIGCDPLIGLDDDVVGRARAWATNLAREDRRTM